MDIRPIDSAGSIEAAAALSVAEHERLRAALPFLPARSAADFAPRIEWMVREGTVLGLYDKAELRAFFGFFVIDDFRNAGPGCLCPDWCHGAAPGARAFDAYRALYREIAPAFIGKGCRIHAAGAYSTDTAANEALCLTGFGRIVLDACRPTADLASELAGGAGGPDEAAAAAGGAAGTGGTATAIRAALPSDAEALAALDVILASHIAAPPVLMPNTHGSDAAEWVEWLAQPDAVAMVAETDEGIIGFLKGEEPQFDVTYSVQDENDLAITGLFVRPDLRGRGIARSLLSALAGHAQAAGKSLMSVDFETMNPEAYAFWPRFFKPVTWSYERRV